MSLDFIWMMGSFQFWGFCWQIIIFPKLPSLKNFNLLVNITCFFSKPHFDKGCEKRILIPINRFSHRCMYRKDMSPLCICTRCSHLIYCHYSQRVHTIFYEMTVCMKLAIGLCSDSIINLYCTLKYSLLINLPAYLSLKKKKKEKKRNI